MGTNGATWFLLRRGKVTARNRLKDILLEEDWGWTKSYSPTTGTGDVYVLSDGWDDTTSINKYRALYRVSDADTDTISGFKD